MFILTIFGIIVNVYISSVTLTKPIWRPCEISTRNKYIGYFIVKDGKPDNLLPFHSSVEINGNVCNNKCRTDEGCYATLFELMTSICSFYNITDADLTYQVGFKYSPWLRCNMSQGYQPDDGRCIGLWVINPEKFINAGFHHNLKNLSSTILECTDQCLADSLCGYINYINNEQCILVSKWPHIKFLIKNMKQSLVLSWICVDNFVYRLNVPKIVEKPNDQKCTGFWTVSSRNSTIPAQKLIYSVAFHTQAYNSCLAECNQYPTCHRAWFNVTYSLCILTDIERTQDKLIPNDSTFIVFDWMCVKDDRHQPEMNSDEKRFVQLGMDCYRIANNTNLFIGMDECGKYPRASKFVRCTERYDHPKWSMKDSCHLNQSYWSIPSQNNPMNISGRVYTNLTKIFTGLQVYWLAYSNDDSLLKVPFLECRSFNASRSIERLDLKSIVTHQGWHAQPPIGPLLPFLFVPPNIVVSSTGKPYYSCRTIVACTDILLFLQEMFFNGDDYTKEYFDMPYNFMIDDDGHIYEGRGWKNQCAAVAGYNQIAICIAYIGRFKYKLPTEPFLNSAKKLIEYAVESGYLTKDYSLYIHQDVALSHVNRFLAISIKNWYRYKGFIPEDCNNISALIISFNILSALWILVCLRISYTLFNFNRRCHVCRFLPNSSGKWQQMYPTDMQQQSFDYPHRNMANISYKYIISDKRSPIVNCDHLRFVSFLKLWIVNRFLETINSRCLGNDLNNYLSSFHPTEYQLKIYSVVLIPDISILICVSNINGINLLKRLVKCNACICHYFTVYFADLLLTANDMKNIC